LAPLANRDDGFRTQNPNPHVDNTIDHPNIKRYTIFRPEDPNSRDAELFHAGQVVLFCCASACTIDGDFRTPILPGGYLVSANAFNDGARLSSKCFVTLNSLFGKAIIPADAINIRDFRLDEDFNCWSVQLPRPSPFSGLRPRARRPFNLCGILPEYQEGVCNKSDLF
jgi:hypothetical protein